MVLTNSYDDTNPEHRRIRLAIERGLGIPNLVTMSAAMEAMRRTGFQLDVAEDMAESLNANEYEYPWYYVMDTSLKWMPSIRDTLTINYTNIISESVRSGGLLSHFLHAGERLHLVSPGTERVVRNLALGHKAIL